MPMTLRDTEANMKTHMPGLLITCLDSLAHWAICWLYGQLLITKPLDSFCLFLVLSPSFYGSCSCFQKGLFLYLAYILRETKASTDFLSSLTGLPTASCPRFRWLNLDLKRHCAFFFSKAQHMRIVHQSIRATLRNKSTDRPQGQGL